MYGTCKQSCKSQLSAHDLMYQPDVSCYNSCACCQRQWGWYLWMQVDANLSAAGFQAADFDAIVSADGFKAIKPAPDIFLAAAAQVQEQPQHCVVIEDAAAGLLAARAAGI